MLDLKKKEFIPFLIVIFTVLIALILSIINKIPEANNRDKKKEESKQKWINSFKKNGIKTIAIVTNNNLYDIGLYGFKYGEIERFYINNEISKPKNLWSKEDFFIQHCEKWYFLYSPPSSHIGNDSTVFIFSPYLRKEYYNYLRELRHTDIVSSKRTYLKKYVKKLPKCKDRNE